MPRAYLDHAASTPMRPAAISAVADALADVPGNPSGQHQWAREARRHLDRSREVLADLVGADPSGVVFTSGGTEADNLAILGVTAALGGGARCLAIDHHAAIEPVVATGGRTLAVDGAMVDLPALRAELRAEPSIRLVSVAAVNSELGVIQPVAEVAEIVRAEIPDAVLHVDAVAAAPWLDLRPIVAVADLVSISGHKVGGPKGVGALVVRPGTALRPVLLGGAQEHERRAGTPNVAGAAGFAVALAEAVSQRDATSARVAALADRLRSRVLAAAGLAVVDTIEVVDPTAARVPSFVHLSCRTVHREALLFRLDQEGVAASSGSSCASGAPERSHVIDALRLPADLREGALRLSLGWSTDDAEIDHAIDVVPKAIVELQGTAPAGRER